MDRVDQELVDLVNGLLFDNDAELSQAQYIALADFVRAKYGNDVWSIINTVCDATDGIFYLPFAMKMPEDDVPSVVNRHSNVRL